MKLIDRLNERIDVLEAELSAAKKRERDMFKALSPSCNGRYPISFDCKWVFGQHRCSMSVCPNINRMKAKVKL